MKRLITTLLLVSVSLFAGTKETNTAHPLSLSTKGSNIVATGNVTGTVQFTLYDLHGRELHQMRQVISAGSNELTLPTHFQKNRVLVMKMSDGNWEHSEQIILQ